MAGSANATGRFHIDGDVILQGLVPDQLITAESHTD